MNEAKIKCNHEFPMHVHQEGLKARRKHFMMRAGCVHQPIKKVGERTYQTVHLAESYRDNGTAERRTLSNMTQWPPEMVAGIEVLCGDDKE